MPTLHSIGSINLCSSSAKDRNYQADGWTGQFHQVLQLPSTEPVHSPWLINTHLSALFNKIKLFLEYASMHVKTQTQTSE